jgi:hypothetical protein
LSIIFYRFSIIFLIFWTVQKATKSSARIGNPGEKRKGNPLMARSPTKASPVWGRRHQSGWCLHRE